MSSNKIETSTINERVLELSSSYASGKAFLKKCDIHRYNMLSELKSGKVKAPSAQILAKIVRGTGCNGSWLLTGQGYKYESENMVAEPEADYKNDFNFALNLVDRIGRQSTVEADSAPTPDDVLKIARLLVALLEDRYESVND